MTGLLFAIEEKPAPDIPGLIYIPDFISCEEEAALLKAIDDTPWLHDLKRRVQHYGYKYDYKARTVAPDAYLGPLPNWLQLIAQKLKTKDLFPRQPDQAIVNEYLPGQGIAAHIDCAPCFDDAIASLTLGSAAMMQFTHPDTKERQELYLKERSLILLSGPARYEWQHSIPARKSDTIDSFKIPRERRVSLTFRNVILHENG